jgi:hypothetical protein
MHAQPTAATKTCTKGAGRDQRAGEGRALWLRHLAGDGSLAGAVEGGEEGALALDAVLGLLVVQGLDEANGPLVVGANLSADNSITTGSLRWRGWSGARKDFRAVLSLLQASQRVTSKFIIRGESSKFIFGGEFGRKPGCRWLLGQLLGAFRPSQGSW